MERRQPSRAAFATQAGALLRKNLRYQRQNWCVGGRRAGRAAAARDKRQRSSARTFSAPTAEALTHAQENQLLPGAHAAGLLRRPRKCVRSARTHAL
jgi:hypothetical protein